MKFNFLRPLLFCCVGLVACKQKTTSLEKPVSTVAPIHLKKAVCCESNIPKRFASYSIIRPAETAGINTAVTAHSGMVWIKAGTFMMGADNKQASPDEYPKHKVAVNGFWMDTTEVTNAQFALFVKATGYITTAERKPD